MDKEKSMEEKDQNLCLLKGHKYQLFYGITSQKCWTTGWGGFIRLWGRWNEPTVCWTCCHYPSSNITLKFKTIHTVHICWKTYFRLWHRKDQPRYLDMDFIKWPLKFLEHRNAVQRKSNAIVLSVRNVSESVWTDSFYKVNVWMMNTKHTFCTDQPGGANLSPSLSLFSCIPLLPSFHFSYLPYASPPLSTPFPTPPPCEIDPGNHGRLVPEGDHVCVCVCWGLCESPPNLASLRFLTAQ